MTKKESKTFLLKGVCHPPLRFDPLVCFVCLCFSEAVIQAVVSDMSQVLNLHHNVPGSLFLKPKCLRENLYYKQCKDCNLLCCYSAFQSLSLRFDGWRPRIVAATRAIKSFPSALPVDILQHPLSVTTVPEQSF